MRLYFKTVLFIFSNFYNKINIKKVYFRIKFRTNLLLPNPVQRKKKKKT